MSHIITDKCIKCKYKECIKVCPVNCFYEGNKIMIINPNECINCGICISECPVDAIKYKKKNIIKWKNLNYKYSFIWNN